MRDFINLIDSMTDAVRLVVAVVALGVFLIAIPMVASVSFVAPRVADDVGERAERLGESAIDAAREQARARELAKDGWGYTEPAGSPATSPRADHKEDGGWAE